PRPPCDPAGHPEHRPAGYWNADVPGCIGDTVVVPHSDAPLGICTRRVAVSLGAITCSPPAVVHPVLVPPPWETPRRNEAVWPGCRVTSWRSRWPKKSSVVCCGVVGNAAPAADRNWMPG